MGKRQAQEKPVDRRDFLKLAGIGGSAVAAAVVVESASVRAAEGNNESQHSGYAETEHIRAYYASARI